MKWIRQSFLGLLVLAGVAVLLAATLRWFAVSDEARADVALLSVSLPPVAGSNGFAALALIDHVVPESRLDAALAGEVERFAAFERRRDRDLLNSSGSPDEAGVGLNYALLEDSPYPPRDPVDLALASCKWDPAGCLAFVRENTDEVRALLAREEHRTRLAAQALASEHLRSPFPPSPSAPMPAYQTLRLPLTAAALDAVEGRTSEALARACGILAGARRHGAGSTDLVGKMVMGNLANGAAGLLLEVRRASPETPLPADCAPALASVRGEDYLICEALRGEFRMVSRFTHELDDALAGKWYPRDLFMRLVAFDADVQDAWIAGRYAESCRDDYREQVLAGHVPVSRHQIVEMSDPTCWGAVISCILSGLSGVDYRQYQARMLDHAAKLRLQLAALAVAEGRMTREAAAVAGASPGYAVQAGAAGDALSIVLTAPPKKQEPEFSVSL
ncbi:hypothetical protein [Arenimonas alkanexedens]